MSIYSNTAVTDGDYVTVPDGATVYLLGFITQLRIGSITTPPSPTFVFSLGGESFEYEVAREKTGWWDASSNQSGNYRAYRVTGFIRKVDIASGGNLQFIDGSTVYMSSIVDYQIVVTEGMDHDRSESKAGATSGIASEISPNAAFGEGSILLSVVLAIKAISGSGTLLYGVDAPDDSVGSERLAAQAITTDDTLYIEYNSVPHYGMFAALWLPEASSDTIPLFAFFGGMG